MNTPANIIRLLDNGSLSDLLKLQSQIAMHTLAKLNMSLSPPEVTDIAVFLYDEIGILLSPVQVERLFAMYPEYKAQVIDSGMDTQAKSAVCNAVAKFFLNCEWPVNGDYINFDKFNTALQQAVPLMRPLL